MEALVQKIQMLRCTVASYCAGAGGAVGSPAKVCFWYRVPQANECGNLSARKSKSAKKLFGELTRKRIKRDGSSTYLRTTPQIQPKPQNRKPSLSLAKGKTAKRKPFGNLVPRGFRTIRVAPRQWPASKSASAKRRFGKLSA